MNLQCHQHLHLGTVLAARQAGGFRLHSRPIPEALAPAVEEAAYAFVILGCALAAWGLLPRGVFLQKVELN